MNEERKQSKAIRPIPIPKAQQVLPSIDQLRHAMLCNKLPKFPIDEKSLTTQMGMWHLWEKSLDAAPPQWQDYMPMQLITSIDVWVLIREYGGKESRSGIVLSTHTTHGLYLDFYQSHLMFSGAMIPPWRWLDDEFTLIWTRAGAILRESSTTSAAVHLSSRAALARWCVSASGMQQHIKEVYSSGDKGLIYLSEDERGVPVGKLMTLSMATRKMAPFAVMRRFESFNNRQIPVVYNGELFEDGVEIVTWDF